MTIDRAKIRKTRICVAEEAARLNGQFSLLGQSDVVNDNAVRLARLELDLINALLGVLDLRLLLSAGGNVAPGNADPAPDESPPDEEPKPTVGAKPLLGIEHASGMTVEFPSISAAASTLSVSMSNLAKIVSNTTAAEWRRGPEHLTKLPYHCTKGWSFILKERLDENT